MPASSFPEAYPSFDLAWPTDLPEGEFLVEQGLPFGQVERALRAALLDPASAFWAALGLAFVAGLVLSLSAFVLQGSQTVVGHIEGLWAEQVDHNLTLQSLAGFAQCNPGSEEQPFLDV